MMDGLYEYGLWGLFLASFLAATILPFSSEAVLAFMVATGFDLYACIWVATIGNTLGGISCYYLGFIGNWGTIEKYLKIKPENLIRTKSWLDKYGSFTAFLTWLPVVGDPLAVGLGIIRSNVVFVTIFMFTGKLLRYFAIAFFTDAFVTSSW
ncbi:MAG: DedA family protein [Bacteroidetes bacterium]|nr:DedA family protein [Bacteroidota bacterium]